MQPTGFVFLLGQLKKVALRVAEIAFAGVFDFVDEVDSVALVTGDAMAGEFGVREELLSFAGGMAGEAAGGVFFGGGTKGEHRVFF